MIPYVGCEYAREHLDGFVDGELSVDEQVAVESHLRWCQTCAARVEDLQLIGHSIRLGSMAPRLVDDETRTVNDLHSSVLIRVRTEEELSLGARFREMFTDMRLLWPALGATAAVTICLAGSLSVLQLASLERPESLATMLDTLANPGAERNPLIAAQPIAPIVKGDNNDMTVQISDASGEPADVELAAACIYMPPPHGHGLPPLMGIEKLSEPGQFKLKQVEFLMDGAWQIQLAIDPAAEGDKLVAFTSCDKKGAHPAKDYAVLPLCMPIQFH